MFFSILLDLRIYFSVVDVDNVDGSDDWDVLYFEDNDSGPGSNEAPQSAGHDFLENLQVIPGLPEVPADLPYALWTFPAFAENQFSHFSLRPMTFDYFQLNQFW